MHYLLKRPLAVCGMILAALTVLGLLTTYFGGTTVFSGVLRAQGYPGSAADLQASYPHVPGEENAAVWYLRAAEAHQMLPLELIADVQSEDADWERPEEPLPIIGRGELPWKSTDFDPELRERLGEYLTLNAETLRLLHQGTRQTVVRFPMDFSQGLNMDLEHLAKMRGLSRLMSLEAVARLLDQDYEALTSTLLAHLRLSAALHDEPVLISHLVFVAMNSMALESLRYALENAEFTERQLQRLQAALRGLPDPIQSWTNAISGERAMSLGYTPGDMIMSNMSSSLGMHMGEWGFELAQRASGSSANAQLVLLRGYQLIIEHADAPVRGGDMDALDQQVDDVAKNSILAAILLPALSRSQEAPARVQALGRLAETSLAIERYRLTRGELSATLEALVPEHLASVPIDPFSGQAVMYRRGGVGYLLYSWGPNGVDDGGTELFEGRRNHRLADLVFRIGIPPEEEEERGRRT